MDLCLWKLASLCFEELFWTEQSLDQCLHGMERDLASNCVKVSQQGRSFSKERAELVEKRRCLQETFDYSPFVHLD